MFLNAKEKKITQEYLDNGFIIRPVADKKALKLIHKDIIHFTEKILDLKCTIDYKEWLNRIHEKVPVEKLNEFRLEMISCINAKTDFRLRYFYLARHLLDTIVGNELAMQLRLNLSIQQPLDDSSLLPVHADTWSGDSPFEVVVWLPLVDCFGTKSMYIILPGKNKELNANFDNLAGSSSESLFQSIAQNVQWLEVPFGHVVLFNQGLPHGNRVNQEKETRWSLNCRFKGVFTPYGDKKIGEFFEPITLRPASRSGMTYESPEVL
jgi:sporadic carbohydrate cluster 2OG-Fe(II) oxygenase